MRVVYYHGLVRHYADDTPSKPYYQLHYIYTVIWSKYVYIAPDIEYLIVGNVLSLIWYPLQAFVRLVWVIDIWHIAKASLVPGRIRTRNLSITSSRSNHYTTGMDKGWDWDPSRYPIPELVYLLWQTGQCK